MHNPEFVRYILVDDDLHVVLKARRPHLPAECVQTSGDALPSSVPAFGEYYSMAPTRFPS